MSRLRVDDTDEKAEEPPAESEGDQIMNVARRGRKRAVLIRAVPRDEVKARHLRRKLRAIELSEVTELEKMVYARPFH